MNLVGGLEHFLIFHILGIIFPIDELISFQSGRSTTNQEFMLASTKLPQQIPWYNDPLQGHPKRLPRSQQWSQRMAVTGASKARDVTDVTFREANRAVEINGVP